MPLPHTLIVPDGKGGQLSITDPKVIEDFDHACRLLYAPPWEPITEKSPPTDHAVRILVFVDGRVDVARRWYSFPPGASRFTPDEDGREFSSKPTHWMALPSFPASRVS